MWTLVALHVVGGLAMAQAPEITSPVGGETWAIGSTHVITWDGEPALVEVSLDGGATWEAIGKRYGEARWAVPDQLSEDCRVKVGERVSGGFSTIPSQEARGYAWQPMTLRAAFAGRDGAGLVALNGKMWLLGGWNPGDKVNFPQVCNSEVWSSTDGAEWTLETLKAPWEGRHTAGYGVLDGKMWVVGGDCIQRRYQTDVWSSADGVKWERVTEKAPWWRRVLQHTVVFDGKLWVIGGQTLQGFVDSETEDIYYNDVWCSEDGAEWTRVTEHAPWTPRGMIGGSAVMNGRMWLLGGGTYDTPDHPQRLYYNDVWSSADGVNWERHVEHAPWHPRQYHDVAVFDERLWVMEGYDGVGNRQDVWYSSDGVNWYELADTPWAPRHAASVCVHDGALWMVAGNNMFPDAWKLVK